MLVTGGSGFIGSHVVPALTALGAEVVIADLRPYADPSIRCVLGDLTENGAVERAFEAGVSAVVHLAAVTSVLGSLEQPVLTYQTNVAMTAALLERARAVGASAFVLASTNAVIGNGSELTGGAPIDELTPLRPLTPYGATKAAAEMLLAATSSAYGVRGVAIRLTNVYGTKMALKDSVVARIMRAAKSGSTFEVYGDGHQVRDYVYAADVAEAMVLGLTSEMSGPVVIGSGTSTSVLDLLTLARSATGAVLPAASGPSRSGEMAGVRVDPGRAAAWGWKPSVGLAEGLARVWESWDAAPGSQAAAGPPGGRS